MTDLPPTPPPETPAAVIAPAAAAAAPIFVDSHGYRYSVTGNTLLPQAVVVAAIQSGTAPKEALDALNKAYVDAGYFLVVIGGQVDNKLVAFTVLQGRISEVVASPELLPFVRRVRNRDDLTRNMLLLDTAYIDFYSARQGVRPRAEFAKAAEVGGTKMTIIEEPIPDAKPWSAGLAFNNLSGRFSSRYTAGATGSIRPGGGLELTGGYVSGLPGLTDDSAGSSYRSANLGATVVTPWGIYGLNFSDTKYQIGEASAPVYPTGRTKFGGVSGTQLVYADPTSRIATTQALTRYSNRQSVFEGLTETVDQNYTVASLGATYTRTFALAGQNSTFGAGVTFLKGLSSRSGTFLPADPGIPDPHFLLTQANTSLSVTLPAGFSAAATLTAQYSDVTLPQSQQWVMGGFGNLSAWLPAVLIGDSGALGRATVGAPPFQWGAFTFSGGAFAEVGISRLEQRAIGEPYTRGLGDLGLSLSGSTSTGTSLTLAYAWPVWYRNVDGAIRDSVDRNKANLYFTLNQTF